MIGKNEKKERSKEENGKFLSACSIKATEMLLPFFRCTFPWSALDTSNRIEMSSDFRSEKSQVFAPREARRLCFISNPKPLLQSVQFWHWKCSQSHSAMNQLAYESSTSQIWSFQSVSATLKSGFEFPVKVWAGESSIETENFFVRNTRFIWCGKILKFQKIWKKEHLPDLLSGAEFEFPVEKEPLSSRPCFSTRRYIFRIVSKCHWGGEEGEIYYKFFILASKKQIFHDNIKFFDRLFLKGGGVKLQIFYIDKQK